MLSSSSANSAPSDARWTEALARKRLPGGTASASPAAPNRTLQQTAPKQLLGGPNNCGEAESDLVLGTQLTELVDIANIFVAIGQNLACHPITNLEYAVKAGGDP